MRWRKVGQIFCPSGEKPWMRSHAAVPTAECIGGDLFKIYFSSRDAQNRSFTNYVVIDMNDPTRIVEISDRPALEPGNLGEFDDSGAMPSWIIEYEGRKLLYYIGWNLGVTVPFRNSVGLAVKTEEGRFERLYAGPIVDRTKTEPHFCTNPCVIRDGERWRMWYLSCVGWFKQGDALMHKYHLRYAESDDGVNWQREGIVCIDFADETEYAISRPSVIRDGDTWHMWYAYRGKSYRIGYATSIDGIRWTRRDKEVGIDVSATGWDSDMIEYPFVFDHNGQRYMLYNGNGYGRTGFGMAILENS